MTSRYWFCRQTRQVLIILMASFLVVPSCIATQRDEGQKRALDNEVTRGFFSNTPQSLRVEPTDASPRVLRVYKDSQLAGYIFSSYEVLGSLGFSGKPIDIEVGLDMEGHILGARLVRHQEPILILGIPAKALDNFVARFTGFDIRTKLMAGQKTRGLPDAVSGASVSSGVIRDSIVRAARNVASAYHMFDKKGAGVRLDRHGFTPKNWAQLRRDGSVAHRKVTLREKRNMFGELVGENPDGAFISLYSALLTPPTIGQNLLHQRVYNDLVGKSAIDDSHIMIAANGLYSFRGRAWRKTGLFDRVEIVQGTRTLRLSKNAYHLIDSLHIAGAPELREIAMFTLPAKSGFDPVKNWQLRLLVSQDAGEGGVAQLRSFTLDYKLPAKYLLGQKKHASGLLGSDNRQLWMEFWLTQKLKIAGVILMLLVLTGILFFQDFVTRDKEKYKRIRLLFLITTVLFLGIYAGAQLSVINVLTFIHALMGGFKWELFLLNPMVFLLWGFVALAMLFWGRGVYCGWLCPFGALQELVNKLARHFQIGQIELPWALHERLWPIKYVAFLVILAVSLSSMDLAFRMAEIEPFKTVIILKFIRYWPFVLYALLLLVAGLFIERFYCRYLCPLGAALAIPARLRMFEWLNRRHQCGRECRICNTTCTVQAISPLGQISPNECVYCLRCQVNYFDDKTCKVLVGRALRRARANTGQSNMGKAKTEVAKDD